MFIEIFEVKLGQIRPKYVEIRNNSSHSMKIDITGALFTLSLSVLISNSQCKEGAIDVNIN